MRLMIAMVVDCSLVPRPRPAFRRLQYVLIATESWAGPGNEARWTGNEANESCSGLGMRLFLWYIRVT